MSQFEQENDLGRSGGEVDDDALERAKENRPTTSDDEILADEGGPGPWANTSSGDVDEP